MRRYLVLALVTCAVAATVTVARASTSEPLITAAAETRVTQFFVRGPGARCDGDSCGIFVVRPVSFRLPAAAKPYSGTLTVSFSYTTTGDGRFLLAPGVTGQGPRTQVGSQAPSIRLIAPTAYPNSTTVMYHVDGLPGGTLLDLDVGLGIGERKTAKTSIGSQNMLVQLRVAPTG
jgi:hypothetical protein